MKEIILALQQKFDQAELTADAAVLETLLAADFFSIGPKGFMLDKTQWIGRHHQFRYLRMDISEVDIRLYEKTAIVRNIQQNKATYNGQEVALATRVTQVWVEFDGNWQLASIQFSPLANPSAAAGALRP
ncbi:nuclear transport factor 2 family protein [Niabella beijingensis]|uniref:nuclear transport factor 2 family protein n=1 Tax=Niabella beijingensis TaxID=2872700 RepID=UPI001CBC8C30|nr:nuclear transport factor 2 family protein [Niabella beijingensis]MBZ4192004.1 nuclear transport factor 2 family protein [Niabella beijingensis]